MFKGKPSLHTFARKHTRKHTAAWHWLSRTHPVREKRRVGWGWGWYKGLKAYIEFTLQWQRAPRKSRQSKAERENWSAWWFGIKAQTLKIFRVFLLFFCFLFHNISLPQRGLYLRKLLARQRETGQCVLFHNPEEHQRLSLFSVPDL